MRGTSDLLENAVGVAAGKEKGHSDLRISFPGEVCHVFPSMRRIIGNPVKSLLTAFSRKRLRYCVA
jgi:hypothetical protein